MASKIEDKGQVFVSMSQRVAGSLVADGKGLEFSDFAPLYEDFFVDIGSLDEKRKPEFLSPKLFAKMPMLEIISKIAEEWSFQFLVDIAECTRYARMRSLFSFSSLVGKENTECSGFGFGVSTLMLDQWSRVEFIDFYYVLVDHRGGAMGKLAVYDSFVYDSSVCGLWDFVAGLSSFHDCARMVSAIDRMFYDGSPLVRVTPCVFFRLLSLDELSCIVIQAGSADDNVYDSTMCYLAQFIKVEAIKVERNAELGFSPLQYSPADGTPYAGWCDQGDENANIGIVILDQMDAQMFDRMLDQNLVRMGRNWDDDIALVFDLVNNHDWGQKWPSVWKLVNWKRTADALFNRDVQFVKYGNSVCKAMWYDKSVLEMVYTLDGTIRWKRLLTILGCEAVCSN